MSEDRGPMFEEFRRLVGTAPSLPSLEEAKVYKEAEIDEWAMSVRKNVSTLVEEFEKRKKEWIDVRETLKEAGLHKEVVGLAKAIEGLDKLFLSLEAPVKRATPTIRAFLGAWKDAWGMLSKKAGGRGHETSGLPPSKR